jgi:hypothetical protein
MPLMACNGQKVSLLLMQRRIPPEYDDGDWPVDRGRPLGLRLLALLGAFSFLMLGLSSLAPLLHPPQPQPPALPDRPKGSLLSLIRFWEWNGSTFG